MRKERICVENEINEQIGNRYRGMNQRIESQKYQPMELFHRHTHIYNGKKCARDKSANIKNSLCRIRSVRFRFFPG